MDPKRLLSIALLVGGGLFAAGQALAQNLDDSTDFGLPQFYGRGKNVSVTERPRPDYDAVGILAGGFTLFPKLELGGLASDNVLAKPRDPISDVALVTGPSIIAQSNWGRHSLTASVAAENQTFARDHSQDQTSWSTRVDGHVDVHGDSYIALGAYADLYYEEPGGALTQSLAIKPVPVNVQGAYARGLYGADRIRVALDADFRHFTYVNVPQIGGGSVIETTRDIDVARVGGRVDYALSPDAAVFARVIYSSGTYLNGAPALRRDYDEPRLLTGVNFDITNLLRGELGVGYIDRSYRSALFHALDGMAVSAKVEYFPAQVLTLTLIAQRLVDDAAFSNASGYFDNEISLQADYELRQNIILSAIAHIERDDFVGITRSDTAGGLQARGTYFIDRNLGVNATIGFSDRTSSGPVATRGPSFNEVRGSLGVVLQR